MNWKSFGTLLLTCVLSLSALGQQKPRPVTRAGQQAPPASAAPSSQAAPQPVYPEKLFDGMKFRLIGPFRGGRVVAVTGVPDEPNTYYFGAVAGGVWKTTDGGVNWTPISDKEPFASVGAIAVASSNRNVIYVGTGEACIRGNISYGDGVYKSEDGGKTWKNVGLRDTRHIGRLIVDPRNPDVVFVAALGHAYGPNSERGVFRSRDGGKSWEKVLYKDDKTGAIDITFDPNNSNTLFAALWEANRTPWSLTSGGPGSGLYKSTDGGSTWKQLTGSGLPKGVLGRIGVAVSGANSDRVFALIEAEDGGIYRSDDGGEKWTRVNGDTRFRQRAWYYSHIYADPKSADTVYVANVQLARSTDGGRTFTTLRAPHGDHHALWIDPANPLRMINGNDGGATVSVDGGKTWTAQDTQPTAQFYHVDTDNRFKYHVYGAQQDNSTVAIASRTDDGVIDRSDWYPVGGGESGYVVPYPKDPNIVYAGSYGGLITRYDKNTGQTVEINPWPENPMGHGAADLRYRFQWTAPILISPHDPNVLYHGANVLFMTTNGGQSWTVISPDLTRNDKSKQQSSGGPVTKDNTSVEYYDTIFALAESPLQKGVIWAGTDDGLVQITRDGGKTWTNITPKDMPEWSTVNIIDASRFDAGTAYIAVDRHELDDFQPYIFKTMDFGKTWTRINNGIPTGAYVRVVRQDPKARNILYAGTETGLYISWDEGARWQPLKLNLPQTPIADLVVKDDDLVVATHGRSFWILDNLAPLRQLSSEVTNADVYFYRPAVAYRTPGGGGFRIPEGGPARVGQNPPAGAILDFYLKAEPKNPITLEILDASGKVVRKYSSAEPPKPRRQEQRAEQEFEEFRGPAQPRLPAKAGMTRYNWDLRYEDPKNVEGMSLWGGRPRGPLAVPGSYQARLTVEGKAYTVPLELKIDPRLSVTQADLERQFELASRIAQRTDQANRAVNQMEDVRSQLRDLADRLGNDAARKALVEQVRSLEKKIGPLEEEIAQTKSKSPQDPLNYPIRVNNKLSLLLDTVEGADAAPTQQSFEVFDMLSKELDGSLSKWQAMQQNEIAALNETIRRENVPLISVAGAE